MDYLKLLFLKKRTKKFLIFKKEDIKATSYNTGTIVTDQMAKLKSF